MKKLLMKGKFDMMIFLTVVTLWVIGNLLVYSATINDLTGNLKNTFDMQIVWTIVGVVVIMLIVSIPTRIYYKITPWLYYITLGMLTLVIFGGESAKGSNRWLPIGGFKLQPSEFAKLGLLIMLARYLSKRSVSLYDIKTMVVPGFIILIPFAMVLGQPDLGTALVFIAISLPMFYWSGMRKREIFFLIAPVISVVLSSIPLVLNYGNEEMSSGGFLKSWMHWVPWSLFMLFLIQMFRMMKPPKFLIWIVLIFCISTAALSNMVWNKGIGVGAFRFKLQDYQKQRVISFINPQNDPRGAGYQVIQSMITMGSGQMSGKGYLEGTQVNLSYLPEQHTDFIFSVLGEQFGFVGSIVVLALYLIIIIRAILATHDIRNRFANLLLVGASSMLAFHIFVNIAMVAGMMPVTGLPLPLLSYGGSFTLTISILIGVILNAKGDTENY